MKHRRLVEAITRSFFICLYTKGNIINPLSLALDKSDTETTPDEGGIEMKYENKTKEEIGYEEMMEENALIHDENGS